jgi:glutaconate CoA-transferase subunit B
MPGAGPVKVITDKAILAADEDTGELMLAALYPGGTEAEVRAGVGWPLRMRESVEVLAEPAPAEIRALRAIVSGEGRGRDEGRGKER